MVQSNLNSLSMAVYDVNQAMQNRDIPKDYQTNEFLSAITNYVLSGTNNSNDKKVTELGKMVFDKYSMQRYKYKGYQKSSGPSGQVKEVPLPNPSYNPNYGQDNGNNQSTKQVQNGSGN